MEGTNIFVLFIIGFVLGCTLVMLLWMASPGCLLSQATGGEGTQAGTSANLTPAGTYTNTILRDSSGRTLAPSGDRGTISTFTDENGRTRDVICYMSYYCVDETPCEEEECIPQGQQCSSESTLRQASDNMENYNPATGAYTGEGTTSTGECCPPYECINGYCGESEECQDQNDICGYVYPQQTTATMVNNQQPTYYGECCPPYECLENRCIPQEECVESGQGCGYYKYTTGNQVVEQFLGECCPPDECVANVCSPGEGCVDTGQTCGTTYPAGTTANYPIDNGDCCPPDECVNNVCTSEEPCQETGALCGYGPPTAATYATNVPANRTWYGDCCEGNLCTDGYCASQCTETGGKCSENMPCCDTSAECTNGVCRTGGCATEDQTCAVGQIDCCTSLYCVSGKCAACQPGGYTCSYDAQCCEGYSCPNGRCEKYTPCMNENAECGKDSDCCDGLVCFDGMCKPEGVCGEAGQTCGLDVECCSGMECSDNDVCVECAPVGDDCGGQTYGGLPCCSTGYCYSGSCQQKAKYMCSDTETGPNYYTAGSATGVYEGDYGTYTDYCIVSSSSVVDYYCEVDGEYSEIQTAQVMCTSGCSGGACI